MSAAPSAINDILTVIEARLGSILTREDSEKIGSVLYRYTNGGFTNRAAVSDAAAETLRVFAHNKQVADGYRDAWDAQSKIR